MNAPVEWCVKSQTIEKCFFSLVLHRLPNRNTVETKWIKWNSEMPFDFYFPTNEKHSETKQTCIKLSGMLQVSTLTFHQYSNCSAFSAHVNEQMLTLTFSCRLMSNDIRIWIIHEFIVVQFSSFQLNNFVWRNSPLDISEFRRPLNGRSQYTKRKYVEFVTESKRDTWSTINSTNEFEVFSILSATVRSTQSMYIFIHLDLL